MRPTCSRAPRYWYKTPHAWLAFAATLFASVGGFAQAHPVLTVTNTSDRAAQGCGSDCTLREAILAANALAGDDRIFLSAGQYLLTLEGADEDGGLTGDLDVRDSLVIQGVGVGQTVIDAERIDRVFHIAGGIDVEVELRDLTVRGGLIRGSYPSGGGGVFNEGAHLTLTRVRVADNIAELTEFGGGGGGVAAFLAETSINECTITENVYQGHLLMGGGGVFLQSGSGSIINSTIQANLSYGRGGGVMNNAAELTIDNSSITGNYAVGDGGATKVAGGGVWTDDGHTSISFSTITDNSSSDGMAGVAHDGTRVDLFATIIAGNHVPSGMLGPDCFEGPYFQFMFSGGYNLIGDARDCSTFTMHAAPTDIVGDAGEPADPMLGALADNGGPTRTQALLVGSPAIDWVPAGSCLATDQRSVPRPFGAGCDIGAYELSSATISGSVKDSLGRALAGATVTARASTETFVTQSASDGSYMVTVTPGTYTVGPSLSGFTFSPEAEVTVLPDAVGVDFNGYDKAPVVFIAGFSSAYETAFPPAPATLRAAGYHVSEADTVNLSDGRVPLMEVNALHLIDAIDAAKHATGQPEVIVVAHSMGGLVSRAYIEGPAYPARRDVQQLFTFGTPHLGISSLWADIVPALASGITAGTLNQGTVCTWLPGFCQMSKANMVLFNTMYQRVPGVDYHVIGGAAPLGHKKTVKILWFRVKVPVPDRTWHNALGLVFSLLIPGNDDAFIQTNSSVGLSGLYVDRFKTKEVHDPALGHRAYFEHDNGESQQSYAQCLKPLLVTRSARTCGVRNAPLPPAGLFKLAAEAPVVQDAGAQDAWLGGEHTAVAWAQLDTAPVNREVFVPEGIATFTGLYSPGPHTFSLVAPSGDVITPLSADGELIQYAEGEGGASYTLALAKAGSYRMVIAPRAGVEAGEVGTFVAFESPTHLTLSLSHPERPFYAAGSTLLVSGSFSTPTVAAQLWATVTLADGEQDTFALLPDNIGGYLGHYSIPSTPGYARIKVDARGEMTDGTAFEMQAEESMLVMGDTLGLSGSFSDQPRLRPDGSGLYESLRVSVGVEHAGQGPVQVSADLQAADGTIVAHANSQPVDISGPGTLELRFASEDIFASAHSGPYVLTHLLLVEQKSGLPLPALDADDVYQTRAYAYRSFAPAPDLPVITQSGPFSVHEGQATTLSVRAVDPEGDPLTYEWDFDADGAMDAQGATVTYDASQDDGPNLVPLAITIKDSRGNVVTATSSLDVVNLPPLLAQIEEPTATAGQRVQLAVPFSDPGMLDTHHAQVDWGDGFGFEPALVTQAAGGGTAVASHRYAASAFYEAELCVTDDDGDGDCQRFAVEVVAPPDCTQARPSRKRLWPPNGKFTKVRVLGAVDADGAPLSARIISIFQDEPVRGSRAGKKAPDASGVGTAVARLRAERNGKANGRVYNLRFVAEDLAGLSCFGNVSVSVPRNRRHPAIDDGPRYDSAAR